MRSAAAERKMTCAERSTAMRIARSSIELIVGAVESRVESP
jgi:hypothetical protein